MVASAVNEGEERPGLSSLHPRQTSSTNAVNFVFVDPTIMRIIPINPYHCLLEIHCRNDEL